MKLIAAALIKAQKEMGTAIKDSSNPYFKSHYADLNAIREACMPALNNNNIAVLQPIVQIDGKNFVKTLLLHESGESVECFTEIIYSKLNDAQSQGSGITYARRYGLQSLVNVGAEDDDGNKASTPIAQTKEDSNKTRVDTPVVKPDKPETKSELPWLNTGTKEFADALLNLAEKKTSIEELKKTYRISKATESKLK